MPVNESQTLLQTVIQGDYCIGCGACAAMKNSPFRIGLDEIGRYQALADADEAARADCPVLAVCPFSGEGPDEDAVAEKLFGGDCAYLDRIGYHQATYAGYVAEGAFRRTGSSGGMGTWLCAELFRRCLVDAVIHVRPTARDTAGHPLFVMSVSRSEKDILAGCKSRYYPVEMSRVLQEAIATPGRYAIVGLPCFVKAVRRLALQDSRFANRAAYCISLICGQLKTTTYADMLAWQVGIPPGHLKDIDFRRKIAGHPANIYITEAIGTSEDGVVSEMGIDRFGSLNWGGGLLKYSACDCCDDVVGETADVSVGDAWLPDYCHDSRGTSVIVVRNRRVADLIEEARKQNRLHLDEITPQTVIETQVAGLRHRRDELAYRLFLKDAAGAWRPRKRVSPRESSISKRRRAIQRIRLQITAESHKAFRQAEEAGRFEVFEETLAPLFRQYKKVYHLPLWQRIIRRLGREIKTRLLNC
jgi:coenzyme F420-reducing hydrogenase beta subunit